MGLLSGKKKTFAERFPDAAGAYNLLNAQQKKVLDEFSFLEEKHHRADKRVALERIAEVVVIPNEGGLSKSRIRRRCQELYQACKNVLRNAELTTNVSGKLFAIESFFQGDEVKTVWTYNTGKGDHYNNTRQKVEENVFGYTIDWNVPIAQAAMTRPVYAGMNYTAHPYGAATAYGSVCLVLKNAVNHRCTYINTDTFDASFKFKDGTPEEVAAARKKICTAAQLSSLLANISNNQLKALCQKSENKYEYGDFPPNYIEAQVHGGIRWSRDLKEIRVATSGNTTIEKEAGQANKNVNSLLYLIAEFAQKHGVSAAVYSKDKIVQTL